MTENKIYRRERYLSRLRPFYDADDLIKVITGIRRCGNKSCSLRSIGGESRDRDVPESNIVPPEPSVPRRKFVYHVWLSLKEGSQNY